jgi:hypothetical protein
MRSTVILLFSFSHRTINYKHHCKSQNTSVALNNQCRQGITSFVLTIKYFLTGMCERSQETLQTPLKLSEAVTGWIKIISSIIQNT